MRDKNCSGCSTENTCNQTYLDCWPKPFGQNYQIPPSRSELAQSVQPIEEKKTDWLFWTLAAIPFF